MKWIPNDRQEIAGTRAERLALKAPEIGPKCTFYETDTDSDFIWVEDDWHITAVQRVPLVNAQIAGGANLDAFSRLRVSNPCFCPLRWMFHAC